MTPARLSDLSAALEAMVASLAGTLPGGVSVRAAGGAFDAAEIRRHLTVAPAVVIACLGLSEHQRRGAGAMSLVGQWAAYVVTRDAPQDDRHAQAMRLVSELLRHVSRATWSGPEAFGLPEEGSLDATNLYSGDLDGIATALWAVTWRQMVHLSAAPDAAAAATWPR